MHIFKEIWHSINNAHHLLIIYDIYESKKNRIKVQNDLINIKFK